VVEIGSVEQAGRCGSGRLMIADCDTNVVFVTDCLERRFPDVYRGLMSILGKHGIPLRTIPGTRDIWCRDDMPVQVAENRFV
jgi:agmatine deiminase